MTLTEFDRRIEAHPDLSVKGATEGDEILVRHKPGGDACAAHEMMMHGKLADLVWVVPLDSILAHEWETLEAVLAGKRSARIMTHLTRIVGYFSELHNWNRSKLAELRDRHGGQYAVPAGGGDVRQGPLPAVALERLAAGGQMRCDVGMKDDT